MTSTPYRKWAARIESGVLTKGQVHSWAYTVAPLAADLTPARQTLLHPAEATALVDLLAAAPVRLTPDHERAGYLWLARYGAKRLNWPGLPGRLDAMFDHLTFDGEVLLDLYPSGTRVRNAAPWWTIHFRDGTRAKYHAAPWQAEHFGTPPPPSFRYLTESEPHR